MCTAEGAPVSMSGSRRARRLGQIAQANKVEEVVSVFNTHNGALPPHVSINSLAN